MADISADSRALDQQKSCLEVIRDAFAEKPFRVRVVLVLTLQQSNPNFDSIEDGLRSRATQNNQDGLTGIAMFVAHFAVLLLEGTMPKVAECVRWLDGLGATRQIVEGNVIFFCDYKSYQLMPTYWSLRPKDFLDMRFEEGEDELSEEAVTQQAAGIYEKMVLLAHELRATNMEAMVDATGLLSKEFIRFAPDPRAIHSLLSAPATKKLLFSLKEFRENLLDDFYAALPCEDGI